MRILTIIVIAVNANLSHVRLRDVRAIFQCLVVLGTSDGARTDKDLEQPHPRDSSGREAKSAIFTSLHFRALECAKMTRHSCPTRAPEVLQEAPRNLRR